MNRSPITVANEVVSIVTVLQWLGAELPDDIGSGRSRKVHCPWGEAYHSDGGIDPAMRVYPDTNSAYCFSCSSAFTPVGLAAQAMDCDRRTAAVHLLDRAGHQPMDLASVFAGHAAWSPEPDKAQLADALKTFCRRIDPAWSTRQFDAAVASTLTRCLSILDLVNTEEDVNLWLTRCKAAMKLVLYTPEASTHGKAHLLLRGPDHNQGEQS